jgi:hypothetical protein
MHNGLRGVWVAMFGQNGVESLMPFVRGVIDDMLDTARAALAAGGEVDLVPMLCRGGVICGWPLRCKG